VLTIQAVVLFYRRFTVPTCSCAACSGAFLLRIGKLTFSLLTKRLTGSQFAHEILSFLRGPVLSFDHQFLDLSRFEGQHMSSRAHRVRAKQSVWEVGKWWCDDGGGRAMLTRRRREASATASRIRCLRNETHACSSLDLQMQGERHEQWAAGVNQRACQAHVLQHERFRLTGSREGEEARTRRRVRELVQVREAWSRRPAPSGCGCCGSGGVGRLCADTTWCDARFVDEAKEWQRTEQHRRHHRVRKRKEVGALTRGWAMDARRLTTSVVPRRLR
jgi:hypothetical protein